MEPRAAFELSIARRGVVALGIDAQHLCEGRCVGWVGRLGRGECLWGRWAVREERISAFAGRRRVFVSADASSALS